MSKGGATTTTQVNTLDPGTQKYVDQYRQMSMRAARDAMSGSDITAGVGGASRQAGDLYGQAGLGFGRLAGESLSGADLSGYMNPYEAQVIGGMQSDFDRQRGLSSQRAADLATQQGAFGGSRSAVLEAQGLRDINQMEGQQLAGLRYGGYMNAQDRAMADRQSQFMGMQGMLGAGQGLLGLDAYRQQIATQQNMDPYRRSQMGLQFGGMGLNTPYGTTSTTTEQTQGNFLNSLLGVAGTVGGFMVGGPPGAALGGQLGGSLGGALGGGGGVDNSAGAWPTAGSGFGGW